MLEGIIPVGLKRMQDGGRLQSGIARVGAQLQQPETSAITPARLAWFLSQLRPTAGLTDVAQMEPGLPSAEAGLGEFMSAEPMPGMATNISEGRYLDAALQGLGAAGDVAYASAPFTAGVGIPVGATLKGIGALGKGIRAGKAARASRGITALEPVDKMRVIADFSENHPTAFNRLFTGGKGGKGRRGRKGISRSKFESGDPSAVERVYARVRGKQESMRLYREAEEAERVARQSRKMLFRPYTSQVESDLKRLGYRLDRRVDPDGEVFSGTSWSTRDGITSFSDYYVHPDTGKTVRVSDHSPVYPRSNRDVMVHPGSFESYDDLVTSLERASRSGPETARIPALSVREGEVPNMSSISASLYNYEVLPGIRSVQIKDFETDPHKLFYAKDDIDHVNRLAQEIRESGEISPLIVVRDSEGPYILEGGHRLAALGELGVEEFPAIVVRDLD